MFVKTKNIGMFSLKVLVAGLFVVLMLVNVQAVIGDRTIAGIDLSVIKLVGLIPSADAETKGSPGSVWKVTCVYGEGGYLTRMTCEADVDNKYCICPD